MTWPMRALLHERRRALHGDVLAAIERRAGTGRSEHADAQAYHAVRAEIWDRAVDALREAGTARLCPRGDRGRRWSGWSRPSSCCLGCRRARTTPDGRSMCGFPAPPRSYTGARSRGSARFCARRNSSPATSTIGPASSRRSGSSAMCHPRRPVCAGCRVRGGSAWASRRHSGTPSPGSGPRTCSARRREPSGGSARRSPGSSLSPMAPMPRWRRTGAGWVHSSPRDNVCLAGLVPRGDWAVRPGAALRGPRRRVGRGVPTPRGAGLRRQPPRPRRCLPGTV